jgi:hypothetical protein
MINLFRLASTYEHFVVIKGAKKLVRIEIFSMVSSSNVLRCRVWIQNIYNLYPALLNSDKIGNDLHAVHSADELNMEISSIVVENEHYLNGTSCESEQEILDYLADRISHYVEAF